MSAPAAREIELSGELAALLKLERGGRFNYFELLGLSPRQASPEDVQLAVAELTKELREVLYDRDIGKEARDAMKELRLVAQALSTPRDIADYRRDIEAAPQRGQMALLRKFEEEARKAFSESPNPTRSLVDSLGKRAESIGLKESMSAALLQRLWEEFAPLPVDEGEVADAPAEIDAGVYGFPSVETDEGPFAGDSAARDVPLEAPGPAKREKSAAAGLFASLGKTASRPDFDPLAESSLDYTPHIEEIGPVGEDGEPAPAPVKLADVPVFAGETVAFDASALGAGDVPRVADPSARTIPDEPLYAPGSNPFEPAGDTSGAYPTAGPPPPTIADAPAVEPREALPPEPPSQRGRKKPAPPPRPPSPAWVAAAAADGANGAGDRRLRKIDVLAWSGLFPAFGKSVKETRDCYEAIRRGELIPGHTASEFALAALDTPSAERESLSSRSSSSSSGPSRDDSGPDLLEKFGEEFGKGPGAASPEGWRVATTTPKYDKAIANAELAFLEHVMSMLDRSGKLPVAARSQALEEANAYGLTMAQAMKLLEERYPSPRPAAKTAPPPVSPTKAAMATTMWDDDDTLGGRRVVDDYEANDPRSAEQRLRSRIMGPPVEVAEPTAKSFARALVHQTPELISRLIGWWPLWLIAGVALAYFGFSALWKGASKAGSDILPSYATPAPVVINPTPIETAAPPGTPVDYLSSPLRAQANSAPNELVRVEARFIDGGVLVPTFVVRRCEVTVSEYQEFLLATGHAPPPHWPGGQPEPGSSSFPVHDVSYEDALAYCQWRSIRDRLANERYALPTTRQYQALFREATPAQAAGAIVNVRRPHPASVAANDAVSYRGDLLLHLFGNVAEWTLDEEANRPSLIGVSWMDRGAERARQPRPVDPISPRIGVGFRYVRVPARP